MSRKNLACNSSQLLDNSLMNEMNALRWLKEAGVDEIASEEPKNFFDLKDTLNLSRQNNRFAIDPNAPAPIKSAPRAKASVGFAESPADYSSLTDIIAQSKAAAEKASNLDELRKAVEAFDGCALKKTANKTVFADGNPNADVMLIGEAPGADEDRAGIPFCGMSGQLLDKVMRSIGLTRADSFYITNTLFWRPPGNRKPTPEELAICKPFLQKHIALVKPKFLLLVGATAVQAILEDNSAMGKLRQKMHPYKNDYMENEAQVMVTYHPSYLMRSPLNKRLAWDDMLMFDDQIKKAA